MALSHEKPDRCPMQISFTPEFAARLRRELGIADAAVHNPHGGGNSYILERTLDQDMLLTSVGWANSYYATEQLSQDGLTYTDEWGVGWRNAPYETPFGVGHYTEMVGHPLADDAAIDRYVLPDPNRSRTIHRGGQGHPRIQGRVLDRRRDGHDDLGDGLGAARLPAGAGGPGAEPGVDRPHPGDPLPLSPGRGHQAGRAGRGHDLAGRRRGRAAPDADLAGHVAAHAQAAHGHVDRHAEGHQPGASRSPTTPTATSGPSSPT